MLLVIVIFTVSEYIWKQNRIQFTGDTLLIPYWYLPDTIIMKVDFLEKIWKENRSCWTQAN